MTLHEFVELTGAMDRNVDAGFNILICPECEEWSWVAINTSSYIMYLIWDDVVIESLDTVSKDEKESYGADFKVWVDGGKIREVYLSREKNDEN